MDVAMDLQHLLDHLLRLINVDEALTLLSWLMIALGSLRLSIRDGRVQLWVIIQRYAASRSNALYILLPAGLALLYVL